MRPAACIDSLSAGLVRRLGIDSNTRMNLAVANRFFLAITIAALEKPVAVRYGWANPPDVNLFNKEGLPATPFRTDVK
jgi:hypothetical protein